MRWNLRKCLRSHVTRRNASGPLITACRSSFRLWRHSLRYLYGRHWYRSHRGVKRFLDLTAAVEAAAREAGQKASGDEREHGCGPLIEGGDQGAAHERGEIVECLEGGGVVA